MKYNFKQIKINEDITSVFNNIFNDLKLIDETYLFINIKDYQSELFYDLLKNNNILLIKIIKTLINYNKQKKFLNMYYKHLFDYLPNEIEYNNLKHIKSKEIHATVVLSCAIVWGFNEGGKFKYNSNSDDTFEDSYIIINETIDYINVYKLWMKSYYKQYLHSHITKKEQNNAIYRIFSILIHNNIIQTETTYTRILKKKKISYSSSFFNRITIAKIYTKPFKYKKIENDSILLGEHYASSCQLCIPNMLSGSSFKLLDEEILNIMSQLSTNIDFDHLKEIYEIYTLENEINIHNIEQEYDAYLKEYKLAIRQNNSNLLSLFSKKLSIYQKGLELRSLLNLKINHRDTFFLPWNHDFRGRTYFLSDLSFTFNKEIRWCMYQDYYKNENDFKPKWHAYNNKIYKILDENIELLNKINNFSIINNNVFFLHSIIWLLISLGEIEKTKIGDIISIKQFINRGITMLNDKFYLEKLIYDDKIKAYTIIKTIKELIYIKNFPIKRRLISKDAPASVFQHLILNFGWENIETLKYCNLLSIENWYDTYGLFINKWRETMTFNENDNRILTFFNRKSLKKVIMTSNYGVGYDSAEKYFKDVLLALKNNEIEETEVFIKENWKRIQYLFEKFFEFLSDSHFLKCSPEQIIEQIIENDGIIYLKDAIVDINYYEKNEYIVDIQHDGKRYTKFFTGINQNKDLKKYNTAAKANYIHALDAALTRWVIKKHSIYTIHDCFLIDSANITFLISLLNEGMNQRFHDFYKTWEKEKTEVFSIFILL